jgi:uncharacterized protein
VTAADHRRTVAAVLALVGLNAAAHRTPAPADLLVPAGVAALVTMAQRRGLDVEDMGLGRRELVATLPLALGAAAATAVVVVAAGAVPGAHRFRADGRYPSRTRATRGALMTIPFAVAIPEEVAFRGVLDASLRRHLGSTASTVAGALAFGAWHALGGASLVEDNAGVGGVLGQDRRGRVAGTAATVAATSLAGLGFVALRRASGSVLPGIAVHWALNATAALLSTPPGPPSPAREPVDHEAHRAAR